MTARTKEATTRVLERIAHKSAAYCFLEIEVTGNSNEFEAYRAEVLEKHPEYSFALSPAGKHDASAKAAVEDAAEKSAAVKAAMKVAKAKGADVEVSEEKPQDTPDGEGEASVADTSTPTDEENMSPRDKARARLLARKAGK